MKKNTLLYIGALFTVFVGFSSCEKFFDVDNATVKSGESYIMEEGEMYSGYVGLITKLQAIGDKAIYLTDTRAEVLEPTNVSVELKQIYEYAADLSGNSYADPAGYYDLIIACNDYLQKAYKFKEENRSSINMGHYQGLIGGALRLKAWTYFTMGKIYGEAVWFDDPMLELKDISQYPLKNLDEIIQSSISLLTEGFDGVDGTHTMSWMEWITESGETNINVESYYYWDMMVPPYFALAAELALWNEDYQRVVSLIMPQINEAFAATSGNFTRWMLTASYYNNYNRMFDDLGPSSQAAVSVIRYNYERDQTNQLLKHFYNDYLLRPSVAGMERYADLTFNPNEVGRVDRRFTNFFAETEDGMRYFHKYRKRSGSRRPNVLQDDVSIYIYRVTELYLMLAEAYNHLERDQEMDMLINTGAYSVSANNPALWADLLTKGYTTRWVNGGSAASNHAIRDGVLSRTFMPADSPENKKHNDIEILRETILEFPGEGKTYPAMIRIARRYQDPAIIADLVCPKYEEAGLADAIRTKIMSGQYFIHWDYGNLSATGQ